MIHPIAELCALADRIRRVVHDDERRHGVAPTVDGEQRRGSDVLGFVPGSDSDRRRRARDLFSQMCPDQTTTTGQTVRRSLADGAQLPRRYPLSDVYLTALALLTGDTEATEWLSSTRMWPRRSE